jgi:hypothetical protein
MSADAQLPTPIIATRTLLFPLLFDKAIALLLRRAEKTRLGAKIFAMHGEGADFAWA